MPSMAVDKAMWGEKRVRTLAFCILVLLVVFSIGAFLAAEPAHADTTFTVDRSDDPDLTSTPTAGDCSGATATDCSLRGAITAANNTPGADIINFAIPEDPNDPADDLKTILVDGADNPASSTNLPDITEAVTINGYTQPWASPNTRLAQGTNANLLIELDGALLGSSGNGLRISASNVVVKGLVIKRFLTGIFIFGDASGTVIEGNFIGTDASGTQNPGQATDGVIVFGNSINSTIGGEEPAARNLISGNSFRGLNIAGDGGNTIQGNLIGTKANGTEPLGNGLVGVQIFSPHNTVGGIDGNRTDTNNPANLIASNGTDGVKVNGGLDITFAARNRILSNSIFSNGDLGIDLDGGIDPSNADGVTANDDKDRDTGPNTLQNFPKLTSATTTSFGTTIKGILNSRPGKTFTIQFFSSQTKDPSGFGEGKTFLRSKSVTTNDRGKAFFSAVTSVLTGQVVSATATSAWGNTSEFSRGFEVP